MAEPDPVIYQHQYARGQKDRVREFYDGESAEIQAVNDVRGDGEEGGEEREGIES